MEASGYLLFAGLFGLTAMCFAAAMVDAFDKQRYEDTLLPFIAYLATGFMAVCCLVVVLEENGWNVI